VSGVRENLLEIRELEVSYPAGSGGRRMTAVRSIDLELGAGEILALVGESGSGKTTVARAVLQLLPIDSGEIRLGGSDVRTLDRVGRRQARKDIQAVFQDSASSLSPRRTVRQALLEPLQHFRVGDAAEYPQRLAAALDAVELEPELLQRYPHELSGGQAQRVSLARALISEPRLIIADEPVSSLDTRVRAQILRLIRRLRDTEGLSFLFITHDLSVARQLADRLAVMYLGVIVERGPAGHVFRQPSHPYTRALLGAVPVPDPAHPRPQILAGDPPSALTPPPGCVFHMRCAERFDPCEGTVPHEIDLPPDTDPESPESGIQGAIHRVRCHLWNN
jgi:oligopeptide/dipeptide ABC transporter ATP-binding protein